MMSRPLSTGVAASPAPALARLIDELTARLQAGEVIDADALAGEHPEYAAELRELLPALRAMADLSRSSEADPAVRDGDGAPLGESGDGG